MPSDPWLYTDPSLANVLAELKAREPIFHHVEFGTSRATFDAMMVAEYWEVGASGRRYDRAFILDELERRYSAEYKDDWELAEFACRQLAADLFLVTYTLLQNKKRESRRATIWQRADGWKIVYHQGTIVAE